MVKTTHERRLSVGLLGPPRVSFGGRAIRFERKKTLALLCYLAAEGGQRPRAELAELFFPKSDERHARTDLRSILSKLKRTLDHDSIGSIAHSSGVGVGGHLLAVDRDSLGVEQRMVELDLRALEAAVSLARSRTFEDLSAHERALDGSGRRDLISRLEGTLGVYRGEFMEGFSLSDAPEFGLWVDVQRVRWRGAFEELCERLSGLQAGAGGLEEAIRTARLWTRHARLEEAAHLRLVELLSFSGDSEAAIMAYEDFRSALERNLGTEPSSQMEELAGRLRKETEGRTFFGLGSTRPASATSPLALEVPLTGRSEEFGALAFEYHAALASGTRTVVVLGEAGMGKTRLVKEFLAWARARGADILEGEASEGANLPYGPLIEAMRPRIEGERAPDDLLEDAWLSELCRLLPELKERYPDLPPAPSGEGETAKAGLFEAIARMVGALASRAPVVLFLDDLHWTDAATLEALDYAGRRWAEQEAPILVVAAARPEEPGGSSGLGRWLSLRGRRPPARNLSLGPLENEDVRILLRRLAGDNSEPASAQTKPEVPDEVRSRLERLGQWLAAETGGQPFYLVETLKALLEEGVLSARSSADGESLVEIGPSFGEGDSPVGLLPSSVRELIRSRFSRLTPVAADLLAAGAVLGRSFGFETLLDVAGLGEEDGLRGLEELTERRLLREDGEGKKEASPLQQDATYSFPHEKIRQVAYTEEGQSRRWVLHRRALDALERRHAPPAELARHALAGGLAWSALSYSMAAGDEAAELFAVRDAIAHYERARYLLAAEERGPGGIEPSPRELERLYTQLGRAHEMADEWEEAREAYEAMLALARNAGDKHLEVASLNHLAFFHFHHENDAEEVWNLLEEARGVAAEANLEEALAETESNLADVMVLRPREFARSGVLAEKALTSARALGRPDLVARALTALARHEVHAGRLEKSAAHAEEGTALSRELAEHPSVVGTGLPSILTTVTGLSASWRAGNKAMEIQCLIYLAYTRIYQGRPREGVAIAREARAISREMPERMETRSLLALGAGLQEAGEYEEALALARRGTERAREVRDMFLLGANLGRLGDVCMALLNLREARAAYEEALTRGHYGALSHARLCAVAALLGDWEDAHNYARRAHQDDTFFNPLLSVHLHHGVEALLRGGDEELALAEVRRLAERAKTNKRDQMSHLRSLAVLRQWEGDFGQAVLHVREAEAIAKQIAPPGELWQIQSRIGELCELDGEASAAREAYFRAAQTLRALAERLENEQLKENFLSAPPAVRVLARF